MVNKKNIKLAARAEGDEKYFRKSRRELFDCLIIIEAELWGRRG